MKAPHRVGARLRTEDLGPGPGPQIVLRRLADEPGLACLWGDWSAAGDRGGVVIMSRPIVVATDRRVLDDYPVSLAPEPTEADPKPPAATAVAAGVIGGGWVGWLGYDVPSYWAFHDHLLRWDARVGRWSFESLWTAERALALTEARKRWADVLAAAPSTDLPGLLWRIGDFEGADHGRHLGAVEDAIRLIRAGEIYQVNVCTRLSAEFQGRPAALFAHAAPRLNPVYGAFIDSGQRAVLSFSPELFLGRHGDEVASSPIKGTWVRGEPGAIDDGAARLRASEKDIAENVMIVDLTRNDLGRVCCAGSVRVSELLGIQAHPGVWHLVSTVRGTVRPPVRDAELISAAFPPGSVTGAPKIRAVDAISGLESRSRGVYTGAIGLASQRGGLRLSVAIRTFEVAAGRIELGVGGGVTVDSVPELEWRECGHKAVPLLAGLGVGAPECFRTPPARASARQLAGGLIETMLARNGTVLRLDSHLARLQRSLVELYDRPLPAETRQLVLAALTRVGAGDRGARTAVRVVIRPAADGADDVTLDVALDVAAMPPGVEDARNLGTAVESTTSRVGLWRHKWADRSWVASTETARSMPLFVAADGCVLETSRGNVFVVGVDGTLVTAPLRDDLLPGVTRQALLDVADQRRLPVQVRPIERAELLAAAAVFWTSSLSGLVPITTLDGRPLGRDAELRTELAAVLGFGAGSEPQP